MTGVAVLNEGSDGEPVVVPIARFSLSEDVEDPDMDSSETSSLKRPMHSNRPSKMYSFATTTSSSPSTIENRNTIFEPARTL